MYSKVTTSNAKYPKDLHQQYNDEKQTDKNCTQNSNLNKNTDLL